MSSDGKPLWGFRKIFFLLGVLSVVYTVAVIHHLYHDRGGAPDWAALVVLLVLAWWYFWFWLQLRAQRFTKRNWRIGVFLLLPTLFGLCFLPGVLFMINWQARTCRDLFREPAAAAPPTS
jgi:hypothetical protein